MDNLFPLAIFAVIFTRLIFQFGFTFWYNTVLQSFDIPPKYSPLNERCTFLTK